MKKSELKTGMKVTLRNKTEYTVVLNTGYEDALISKRGWLALNDYDSLLNFTGECLGSGYDIIKVERPDFVNFFSVIIDWELAWEREEVEEITGDEAMRRLAEQAGHEVKIIR